MRMFKWSEHWFQLSTDLPRIWREVAIHLDAFLNFLSHEMSWQNLSRRSKLYVWSLLVILAVSPGYWVVLRVMGRDVGTSQKEGMMNVCCSPVDR